MRNSNTQIRLIAFALVLVLSGVIFAQDSNLLSQPQTASDTTKTRTVTDGQKLKIEGIVVQRNGNTFRVRGSDGTETEIVLTDKSTIKIVRKGLFRQDQTSGPSDILRGLRLKAEGKGNSDGQLVAENIRFEERDLRTAQALESRVDPVEDLATSAQTLGESNSMRIDRTEKRLDQAEQNAQQLSGQVEELSSVANAAGAAAEKAQTTADQAQADASAANQRIDSLDDYEAVGTMTVHFKSGSARLSTQAKNEIDEVATSLENETLKGWILAVVGYADSKGESTRNRSLSERRANAVINYLVTKHGLPLRRVVQPFGYGSLDPVATNRSKEGRSLNRRAEITVLVNKGIGSQARSPQTSSEDQLSRRP